MDIKKILEELVGRQSIKCMEVQKVDLRAKKQLQLGQIAYLLVLNAQNTYAQARLALVQAQANRLADTAALFQALGGGWWHRPADPATTSVAAK